LKQLLAASTASQLGFVVLAAGVGAREAGAAHLVGHAAVKSLLFLAAGLWLHLLHTRDLGRLTGAALRTPAVGILATIGLLALGGLPPFALWGTKDAVLDIALERSPALYAVGLLGALLSAAYAGRALAVLLRVEPDEVDEQALRPRWAVPVALTAWAPLVVLAVGAALLGVLVVGGPAEQFGRLVGSQPAAASVTGLVVSGLLAAVVLAVVWTRGEAVADRLAGAPMAWLHLEAAAHAVAVRPVLALSKALAHADDHVLDRAVMGVASRVRAAAGVLGRADDRVVDAAVEGAARGTARLATASGRLDLRDVDGAVRGVADLTRRLGEQARRPQTGQLHHYYGQAAVVLVAATALLLIVR
ncbi:MAG: NADH-quinone oxidoreductase subunit L, partial [Frankiales bacterium]|nr:NADH-quinone oxidoreductase subunit L [Frankiales bacterium]